MGLGNGMIIRSGYSVGGFQTIYQILYKYCGISIGKSSLWINGVLIILSGFFFGLSMPLYAVIGLYVSSVVTDKVMLETSVIKTFYIVTNKPLEIKEYIMDKLHYSVTVINARGGYTNKKRKILMCVVPTIEYLKLKELVNLIDSKAFFLIVDTYESSVKKNCKNM